MQTCPGQNAPAGDLGTRGSPKGGLKLPEMAETGLWRGLGAEQRAESTPVHGANRAMSGDGKHQRRDVVAPMGLAAQAVARPTYGGRIVKAIGNLMRNLLWITLPQAQR